jgi:hypothetical protein
MTKRKIKKRTSKKPLHGTPDPNAPKNNIPNTLQESGVILLAAIFGGGIGAAIGKHSLLVGIPISILGVHYNYKQITALGVGMAISNGFQSSSATPAKAVNGVDDDMHGFDINQIKDRVGTYFKNFSEKLYLPKTEAPVNATDEMNGDEMPTRFLNPYNDNSSLQGDIDLSQMDKVKAQIAQMNGMEDREF